jgi:KaiC/GvpD/RAD55 family RecA-like ATPase
MTETALIRTLLNKEFYDNNKGIRCPDELFTKDMRKIKQALDQAMELYQKDISPSELEALFFTANRTMTTANKDSYQQLFKKIENEKPMHDEIATEVMSRLFQQYVGEKVANLGFKYVNGEENNLESLRNLLDDYKDNFTPNLNIKFEDIELDTVLEGIQIESQWKMNIPSLRDRVEGISGGHLVMVGARPNTGKTTFHASLIASPGGFAHQGAKCLVLTNEEKYVRVAARYVQASSGMTIKQIVENKALALKRYNEVKKNVQMKDSTGKDMNWVEAVVKSYRPDIVVLDMGDKFANRTGDKTDIYLKDAAIHARNIAKLYDCAVIWMSQLSAVAEGVVQPDMSMMEGSKTGKAAEADLMILISKNRSVEGVDADEDLTRYLTIAKNKLDGGWHGRITCELDGDIAQYTA